MYVKGKWNGGLVVWIISMVADRIASSFFILPKVPCWNWKHILK